MFKFILVPSTGSVADLPVLHTALAVARMSAAHICVLDVYPDLDDAVIGLAPEMIGNIQQKNADRQEEAQRFFRDFCETESLAITTAATGIGAPSAELKAEAGDARLKLAAYGRTSDLVVLGRSHEDAELARIMLETAIMHTGRPVLIAPSSTHSVRLNTVAIAWKDTIELAKAVSAALPFIERAERVLILTVQEEPPAEQSVTRLLNSLLYHNASTTVHVLPQESRPAVETLLDRVNSVGVSLLVMGAYGHSRLRELVLGGFTRHVLNTATPPILLAH